MGISAVEKIDVPEGMHLIATVSLEGDTRLLWNPADAADRKAAKAAWDAGKKAGMTGYRVDVTTGEASREVIREWDPEAGKVIMMTAPAGG